VSEQLPVAGESEQAVTSVTRVDNADASARITMDLKAPIHSILRGCDLLRTRQTLTSVTGNRQLATGN
jgi:hypothetical protein